MRNIRIDSSGIFSSPRRFEGLHMTCKSLDGSSAMVQEIEKAANPSKRNWHPKENL